jgi:hypothetical protein
LSPFEIDPVALFVALALYRVELKMLHLVIG